VPGKQISVAVAGLGVIARTVHLPLLERRRDLFTVAAVSDLSRTAVEDLGARYGVPAMRRHTDAREMIAAGECDAVLLLTSGSHGELVAQALRAGIPVFCEKPLAYTQAEAVELARIAADDARVMVGYMKQYDPAVAQAAEQLAAVGGAAAVHAVDVTVLHPSGESQLAFAHLDLPSDLDPAALAEARRRDVELVRAAVGVDEQAQALYRIMVNSASHDLSLLRLLTGAPTTVDHVATWASQTNSEPSVDVGGTLPGGGRYRIGWHYLPDYPAYRETIAVHHATGSLELVFPTPYLVNAPTTLTTVDAIGGGERRTAYRSVVEAFEEELVAFHAMVTCGIPPRTGIAGGLDDLATSQRVVRRFGELTGAAVGGEAATA
jgi:myo-inositol 2-dehydrogenase / D-chiro-inositol 1-dehydrogenase